MTKKNPNPSGLNTNPSFLGKCNATTAKGQPCRHMVVFANGFCAQHGGATPPEYRRQIEQRSQDKFERRMRRLDARVERTKKWLEHQLSISSPSAADVQALTDAANLAAQGSSQSPSAQESHVASGTAAMASKPARKPRKARSKLSPISAAPEALRDALEPSITSSAIKTSPSPNSCDVSAEKISNEVSNATNGEAEEPERKPSPEKTGEEVKEVTAQRAPARHPRADSSVLPPELNPHLVPGESWTRYYKNKRLAQVMAAKHWYDDELRKPSPPADLVDPPTFND